jgi:hypothetical protein
MKSLLSFAHVADDLNASVLDGRSQRIRCYTSRLLQAAQLSTCQGGHRSLDAVFTAASWQAERRSVPLTARHLVR